MERKYAGFWIRVLASGLDALILIIPSVLIEFLSYKVFGPPSVGYFEYQTDLNTAWTSYETVSLLLSLLVGILFYGVLTSKYGGTVGKMVLGLRVVGDDGENISLAKAIGRYFAYIPSGFFMIGYLMVGISKKKQGLHDKMCKTYVIHK